MLRRVIAAVALIALASVPAVARTRFFCRYTGVELTGCGQQNVPDRCEIQGEPCCDRRTTRSTGFILVAPQPETAPPASVALPVAVAFVAPARPPPVHVHDPASPVFLITRALLI
jgi:hypothetical protein